MVLYLFSAVGIVLVTNQEHVRWTDAIVFENLDMGDQRPLNWDISNQKMDVNQERCWSLGQLYWNATNQCYKPATQGPCESKDHWIVLLGDPSIASNVQCRPRPCPAHREALFNGRCYSMNDASVCQDERKVLVNSPFGFGYCVCKDKRQHIIWPADQQCYLLYRQGPCSDGQYLSVIEVPAYNSTSFYSSIAESRENSVECTENICGEDGLVLYNNSCRRLEGPCDNSYDSVAMSNKSQEAGARLNGSYLTIDVVSMKPICRDPYDLVVTLRQIAQVGYNCGILSPMRRTSFCRPIWKFG